MVVRTIVEMAITFLASSILIVIFVVIIICIITAVISLVTIVVLIVRILKLKHTATNENFTSK